jgi:hypothetical protein
VNSFKAASLEQLLEQQQLACRDLQITSKRDPSFAKTPRIKKAITRMAFLLS